TYPLPNRIEPTFKKVQNILNELINLVLPTVKGIIKGRRCLAPFEPLFPLIYLKNKPIRPALRIAITSLNPKTQANTTKNANTICELSEIALLPSLITAFRIIQSTAA